jgi:Nucleotidyl transferase AbiEii toxin, Type IV TA system
MPSSAFRPKVAATPSVSRRIDRGRPAHLLEKDVWAVWALAALYQSALREHLVFKGGTSLSKAYGVIRRFSEDVDLTYDIRVSRRTLWAPMAKHCRRRAARRNGGRAKSAGVCRSGSPGPRSP